MINHPEPIDMAMSKAIRDGNQRNISDFVSLPTRDAILERITRTHRVKCALALHEAYENKKGGEKI